MELILSTLKYLERKRKKKHKLNQKLYKIKKLIKLFKKRHLKRSLNKILIRKRNEF